LAEAEKKLREFADDRIIVLVGILLAIKLMPGPLLDEHRRAARAMGGRGTGAIAALWVIASLALVAWLAAKFLP
jgi:hypothetical protein